jgi:UDP-glucose 4-epimerase
MEIKNTRVLVTGGAGFIGSHIADRLVQEGAGEIIIFDNFSRGARDNLAWASANGHVTVVEGDIIDAQMVMKAMQGVDFVIHEAAIRITQCAQEPRLAIEVLIDGTFNVMEAAVKANVKKVIIASSASVYGTADSFPTNENHHPYNNRTLYGAAKVANEGLFRAFNDMYGLNYNATRCFNVYGPRMDIYGKYTEVFIRWYNSIKEGKPPVIFGDGKQSMDFVYVEDVARAKILALKADVSDEVFNIASGVETSLEGLCEALLEAMGSDLRPDYIPLPDERKKVEVTRRRADVAKASNQIGFKAEMSLSDGLKKLVQWLESKSTSSLGR